MHVHVSPISGPEWGKFLLFSHSVNSYRASVCQALGVFFILLPFIIVPCPVFLDYFSLQMSVRILEKVWDNISNLQNARHCQGHQSTAHTPEKESLGRGERIKMQDDWLSGLKGKINVIFRIIVCLTEIMSRNPKSWAPTTVLPCVILASSYLQFSSI